MRVPPIPAVLAVVLAGGIGSAAAQVPAPDDYAAAVVSLAERCGAAALAGAEVNVTGLAPDRQREGSSSYLDDLRLGLVVATPEPPLPPGCFINTSPGYMPEPPDVAAAQAWAEAANARLTGYLFDAFDAEQGAIVRRCRADDLPRPALEADLAAARISADGARVALAYLQTNALHTGFTVLNLGPLGNCPP